MTLLDTPQVSGCYFFPRRDPIAEPHVVSVDDVQLHCHDNRRDASVTLLHFHGNGGTVGDYVNRGADDGFQSLDARIVFAEYRGYGGSNGEPQLVAQLDDCEAILDSLDVSDQNVIVFGRSIGSLYAVELAARRPNLGGLVLESGIDDPAERFLTYADLETLGVSPETVAEQAKHHFDHEAKLRPFQQPSLVLHAEDDSLINLSHAQRNHGWLSEGNQHARLVTFAAGGHNAIMMMNYEPYFNEVAKLIQQVAQRAEG